MSNKRKIINDPVHGFITISDELLFDIIEHPFFQRLRRINQLGLSYLVYPGATHTRFGHTLGAMFLTGKAIETLRIKGAKISDEESLATHIAILFHDMGHAPFSHSLENKLVEKTSHEKLSLLCMEELNKKFDNKLELAIKIFKNEYSRCFLHQLVSSQLDMDRLDYLSRDSFFTGVSEGIIGTERIISMLNVHNDQLVVEEKGIYSIEKFIISRRLMYWQVYLHKAVLSSELILVKMIERAKELKSLGENVFASPNLSLFLERRYTYQDFLENSQLLYQYMNIDDSDIMSAAKVWTTHPDLILSKLAKSLVERHLFKMELQPQPFSKERIEEMQNRISKILNIDSKDIHYFVSTEEVKNNAYSFSDEEINILYKNGDCKDISKASDQLDKHFLEKIVRKYYLSYPKIA
ncbi:HD domain-containing protein [Bacteroidales bacterium OttesenSCG-928-C19]|nr:HD domain-containing protein [Bacteroidales bacterium OttesenSCG-928-C19]